MKKQQTNTFKELITFCEFGAPIIKVCSYYSVLIFKIICEQSAHLNLKINYSRFVCVLSEQKWQAVKDVG